MISIIEYQERYAGDFRELNLEWLDKYHLTESHDLAVLDDPKGTILDRGGHIFLALTDGRIVGTAALMKEHDDCFELAKMSVAPAYRGKGISKLLMSRCLDKAREIGVKRLILYSNSQLQTAIRLYTQFGFQHVPVVDSPFVTADVKMELFIPV